MIKLNFCFVIPTPVNQYTKDETSPSDAEVGNCVMNVGCQKRGNRRVRSRRWSGGDEAFSTRKSCRRPSRPVHSPGASTPASPTAEKVGTFRGTSPRQRCRASCRGLFRGRQLEPRTTAKDSLSSAKVRYCWCLVARKSPLRVSLEVPWSCIRTHFFAGC